MTEAATVSEITTYPVKGLSPQRHDAVPVEADAPLPGDRHFAIAHGASRVDPTAPQWAPKRNFLVLLDQEKLAQLETDYDPESGRLTIRRHGQTVTSGDIRTLTGRQIIQQFLAGFLGESTRGMPRVVEAQDGHFADRRPPFISIVNRESVRDLERIIRRPVDPERFRGNILVEGAPPWSEFDWVGRTIRIGDVPFTVTGRITRCPATDVNPQTAERDMNIPKALEDGYGHQDCGVLARAAGPGTVHRGDRVEPLD